MNELFEGIIAACATPVKNYEIDEISLKEHLEFLQKNGVSALISGGTTGEFFSLGRERRQKLFDFTRKNFNGKIIFNVSDTSLFDVKNYIIFAQNAGADGITLIPPFYLANAPVEGVVKFLNEAISFSKIPCMLYNFTKHTQNKITAEILKSVPHAALKDSDRDENLISHTPSFLCGGDSQIFTFYKKGAKGAVSVMANYCPKLVFRIWNELQNGDFENAFITQKEICEIANNFRKDDQIARIKYALSKILRGYSQETPPPLLPAGESAKKEIDELFQKGLL
ncbi:MAG: dihydrodipicolinate synthase family protein [Chitinivibrionia bacterium]|nr:dihydrodipicolinate synthase family protein [Chitinivibrionia bacterium]